MVKSACRVAALALAASLSGAGWAQVAMVDPQAVAKPVAASAGPSWILHLPKDAPLVFHGVVSYDKAGMSMGPMSYPAAGGAIGLLAGILTHSALSEASRNQEKNSIAAQADNILGGYKAALQSLTIRDLMLKGVAASTVGDKLPPADEITDLAESSHWIVESQPVFFLTQDQSTLIVENNLTVFKPGASKSEPYRSMVRVVAEAQVASDMLTYWTDGQAIKLKDEATRLLAQSLDLALTDAQGQNRDAGVRKTVRYMEGRDEKMERGEVLSACCGRILIRTLRGGLLSAPLMRPAQVSEAASR